MEENNRPTPANAEAAKNNNEGRNRRRGHRGGKRHGHGKNRPDGALQEAEKHTNAPVAQTTEKSSDKKNERKGEQKPAEKKNDRKNKKQRDRRGGKPQRDHIAVKDDIYGDPKEEKELAEWRARIVLNAEPTPAKSPLAEESTEEVAIPEGIDLLESSILNTKKSDEEQVEVVGIRFRSAGKMYYFAPKSYTLKTGDHAIVETARGPEFGDVCLGNTMVDVSQTVSPLRPILRVATDADVAHNEENRAKEKEAFVICQKKIEEHKLDMKLIDVQYAFDNSKLLFYFSSEGRVDFRELVKDLASVFRTRIELRQIGIRDEAKLLGGFGACGRTLCCSTFLPDFAQVSIKMAKEQGLSLNSAKISGLCGRLMCCLRFESDVYAAEHRLTPPVNSTVKTEDGIGNVISTNPLAGTVRVVLKDSPDTPPKQYHRDNVTVLPKEKHAPRAEQTEKED